MTICVHLYIHPMTAETHNSKSKYQPRGSSEKSESHQDTSRLKIVNICTKIGKIYLLNVEIFD